MAEKKRLCIVIPVYNDWESITILINEITLLCDYFHKIKVLIVNDASTDEMTLPLNWSSLEGEIIHLRRNLGHQKAIAIGISYLAKQDNADLIVVMDGDGEDDPADILRLAKEHNTDQDRIVFAKRLKRKRSLSFLLLYAVYKIIFRLFTGKAIVAGNFCLIPGHKIKAVAHIPEIWNHFSGGIMRSNISIGNVLLNRRKRISGKSNMNLVSLVVHGISSISVYIDIVSVRLIIFFGILIVSSIACILTVVSLKVYTALAIPGWASTVGIGLVVIILQSFFISLILSFIILSYRSQMVFIPAIHYSDYILKVDNHG